MAFRTEATVSFPGVAGANDHNLRRVLISNNRILLTQRCRDRTYSGQILSALEGPLLILSALGTPGIPLLVAASLIPASSFLCPMFVFFFKNTCHWSGSFVTCGQGVEFTLRP